MLPDRRTEHGEGHPETVPQAIGNVGHAGPLPDADCEKHEERAQTRHDAFCGIQRHMAAAELREPAERLGKCQRIEQVVLHPLAQ